MSIHELYMQRCLQLAGLGKGKTLSNPLVGAVLVYNDKIIGEGYHQEFGKAHAEVNCINSVKSGDKELIPTATLYVNLEPCNHTGKTPPCTDLIIESNIKRVIIGTTDSNPLVSGKGIERLKAAGIEVSVGILPEECYRLNRIFFTNQQHKRTYVKLKWAQTLNGFVGNHNTPVNISDINTNVISHKYRTLSDGILVGFNTVKTDKPKLTARLWQGKQPIRIIVDQQLEIPSEQLGILGHRTLVLNLLKKEKNTEVEYVKYDGTLASLLQALLNQQISSIIVEGGPSTHSQFIKEGLWDEAIVIVSDKTLPDGIRAAVINGKIIGKKNVGEDTIYHLSNTPHLK